MVALWLFGDGLDDIHDTASLLTGLGRVTGLLGAYLALRPPAAARAHPALERIAGFDRLTAWHRLDGRAACCCCSPTRC